MLALRSNKSICIALHMASLALPTPTVATTSSVKLVVSTICVVTRTALLVLLLVLFLIVVLAWSDCLAWLRGIGYWARNSVRRFINVKLFVDILRNRLDLCAQFLFNSVQVEAIIPVDKVDRKSQMPKTPRPTNSVKIRFGILREVKIYDNVDCLNIDTTSQQVRTDKVPAYSIPEIMENTVAVLLEHASM